MVKGNASGMGHVLPITGIGRKPAGLVIENPPLVAFIANTIGSRAGCKPPLDDVATAGIRLRFGGGMAD